MAYSLGLIWDGYQSVSDAFDAYPYHQLNPDVRTSVSTLKEHARKNVCKLLSCLSTLSDSAQTASGPALFELDKRLVASAFAISEIFSDEHCWRGSQLLKAPLVQQQLRRLDRRLTCMFQTLLITITAGVALNTPQFLIWLSDCFSAVERSPEQIHPGQAVHPLPFLESFPWRCSQQQFQAAVEALESTSIPVDVFARALLKVMYRGAPPVPPALQLPTSSCTSDFPPCDSLQEPSQTPSDFAVRSSSNCSSMTVDPLTFEPMCDPVICSDGRTYDRFTILNRGTAVTSPFSLDHHELHITGVDHAAVVLLTQEQKEQQAELRSEYRAQAVAAAAALDSPGPSSDVEALAATAAQMLQDVLQWDTADTQVIQLLEKVKVLHLLAQQEREQLRGMLLDPITQELICDPVLCSDGYTYDRFTILNHEGRVVSPFDGQPLRITEDDCTVASALPVEQLVEQTVRRCEFRTCALHAARQLVTSTIFSPLDRQPFQDASDQLQQVLQWAPLDREVAGALGGLRKYQEQQEGQVAKVCSGLRQAVEELNWPFIVALLHEENPALQAEACRAVATLTGGNETDIRNGASGSRRSSNSSHGGASSSQGSSSSMCASSSGCFDRYKQNRTSFLEASGVVPLATLLQSPLKYVQLAAAVAVQYACVGNSTVKAELLQADAVPALLNVMVYAPVFIQAEAAGALRELFTDYPASREIATRENAVPVLVGLLECGDSKGATAAAAALAALAPGHERWIAGAGAVPLLTELLKLPEPDAQATAADALAAISQDIASIKTAAADAGAIPVLVDLLKEVDQDETVQHSAATALAVMCREHQQCQVQARVAGAGDLVHRLLTQLKVSALGAGARIEGLQALLKHLFG